MQKDKRETQCTGTGRGCKRDKTHEVKAMWKQGAGGLLGSQYTVPVHRCYLWEHARINRQKIFIQHSY